MTTTGHSKWVRQSGKCKRRGQALVELSLVSVVLALLLAAAVDFGRIYYTASVVSSMAAEGAAYAASNPELDLDSPSCSIEPVTAAISLQERARRVARNRGLVISSTD